MKNLILFKLTFFLFLFLLFNIALYSQVIDLSKPSVYNGYYQQKNQPTITNEENNFEIIKMEDSSFSFNPSLQNTSAITTSNEIPTSVDISTNYGIGEIPIISSTTPAGAVVYSVPIESPIGLNGLKPDLSILYNSQFGDGLLGIGWNLSGLSSITRTGSTIFHDGVTSSLSTESTQFNLDGMRLITNSISDQFFKNYTTEIEQDIKIDCYLINKSIYPYFKVYFPGGSYAIYGFTDNKSNQFQA